MQPLLPADWAPRLSVDVISVAFYVVREILIGVVIGYIARAAFDGILMAANICAYQMGFGTATLLVPEMGGTIDAFTMFHRMVIFLIFLTLGLHHVWISALADSFRLLPGGSASLQGGLGTLLLTTSASVFSTALQLAAPLLVALMFAMAALGLVSRTVPQMNVFSMSFPVSFSLGLIMYAATLPFFPSWIQDHFDQGQESFFAALRLMKG